MWNRDASQSDTAQPPQAAAPAVPLSEAPAIAARAETERRQMAWLGKSVVFKGELISSEDMTIDGRVEGTIEAREHTVTVGLDARLDADVAAKIVIVLGAVTGSITASEKVVLGERAVVEGDVTAPRLGMFEGAHVRGRVETATRPAKATDRVLAAV
jgi:cytoskeletal protein CcmA (bactofilin family)